MAPSRDKPCLPIVSQKTLCGEVNGLGPARDQDDTLFRLSCGLSVWYQLGKIPAGGSLGNLPDSSIGHAPGSVLGMQTRMSKREPLSSRNSTYNVVGSMTEGSFPV